MRRPAHALALAAAAVAALGAGGCGSSSNEPDPAPISLDEFPAAFAKAYCHRVYSCCRPEDRIVASPGDDEATCTTEMTENASDNARLLFSFGGVGYFEDRARRCLEVLAYGPCGAIFEPGYGSIIACQDVFAGTRALGERCEDSHQCLSGACAGAECVEAAACGADAVVDLDNQCQPRAALGGPCFFDAQCPATAACVADVCKLRGPVGAACTSPADCTGTCAPTDAGAPACRVGFCAGE
ncbi:MAG TPA: EB domain-containing protein [Polyangia bacterium]|nr:EB domain-containing protein [Polyangia bacterium]